MYLTIVDLDVLDAANSRAISAMLINPGTATISDEPDVFWDDTIYTIAPDPPQLMGVSRQESYFERHAGEICRP
jgi:hypothetical protein